MKTYVVTSTKVILETYRIAAPSREQAINRVMAGDESSYDAKILKQSWNAALDVPPRKS